MAINVLLGMSLILVAASAGLVFMLAIFNMVATPLTKKQHRKVYESLQKGKVPTVAVTRR